MSFIRWKSRAGVSPPPTVPFDGPVIVVGTGPSGMRVAQELVQRSPECRVRMFGDERWRPYNRVRLTSLMVGDIRLADVYFPALCAPDEAQIEILQRRIVAIDRESQTVTDMRGDSHRYGRLVLATGSRPHVPLIAGVDQANVFTFRDLDDVEKLMARIAQSRRAVVIGGGLLGLEAARGLHQHKIETVVIEHERHLMPRQLDDRAGEILADHMGGLGVAVVTGDGIREIVGDGRVAGVRLLSGREIACDTVVVCTGIRPNVGFAQDARLSVGHGIRVDDHMRTSDPTIYAVGECAEHREKIYGLVAPGLEQAAVAAHAILGGESQYGGSIAATRLKVVGIPVFNIGAVAESEHRPDFASAHYEDTRAGVYRRLILDRGRIVGTIAVGAWADLSRIQEAVVSGRRIYPWQVRRFRRVGSLWPTTKTASVGNWPGTAIVCNCTGVTRGMLSAAIADGAGTIATLQQRTGASTVCGSCRLLLGDLLGTAVSAVAIRSWRVIAVVSALSLLAALAFSLLGPVPYRQTVQAKMQLDLLWTDGTLKQITGFSLLGLALLVMLLSFRKRIVKFSFGDLGLWRIAHTVLGLAMLTVLFLHTGLNLGHNLNLALMTTFLAIVLAGALAGGVAAARHRMVAARGVAWQRLSVWVHIIAFWPLLVLLTFHVLSVYYF